MSKMQIPESWARITLDDACDLITCGVAAKPQYVESGIPFLSAKNVQDEKVFWEGYKFVSKETHQKLSKHNLPRKGDILYTRVGSYGEAAIVDKDDEFSIFVSLTLIKPKPTVLLNTFLKNWLNSESVKALAKKSITGVGVGNLNVGAVRKFIAPLPPLGEQKRIVAKIESTQEKIKTIESSISKAEELIEEYRESLLQKAFRGELVAQDPSDEPASKLIERIRNEQAKQSDGKKKKKEELPPIKPEEIPFEIPKSWEWVRLDSVLALLTDYHANGAYEKLKEQVQIKEEPDYAIMVRTTNFSDRGRDKYIYVSKSAYDFLPKSKLLPGDLIMNKIADPGAVFMTEDLGQPMTLAMNLFLLRLNPRLANNLYLFEYLKLNEAYIKSFSKGATTKTITKDAVRNLIIPLPPLNEQIRINETLKAANKSIQFVHSAFAECLGLTSKLKIGTLDKAFCGDLVEQVSSEGTGHELLEKIQSEQSPDPKSAKKTSTLEKKKRVKK